MKEISCPQEAVVTHSARTGCWDNSAKEHVKGCPYCREIVQIVGLMRRMAGAEEKEQSLTDAEQVWINARMRAIQEAQERILRPLVIAEFAVKTILMLTLVAGIIGSWFGLQSLAANSLPSYRPVPQSILAVAPALATCVIALLFLKLIQPVLIEE
jgi:predicted anti-sigma-YlaC factor YlaD